jgi:hypothetical protein
LRNIGVVGEARTHVGQGSTSPSLVGVDRPSKSCSTLYLNGLVPGKKHVSVDKSSVF